MSGACTEPGIPSLTGGDEMQASHRPHFTFLEQLIIILKGPTRPCQTWPLLTSPGSSRAFLHTPVCPSPLGPLSTWSLHTCSLSLEHSLPSPGWFFLRVSLYLSLPQGNTTSHGMPHSFVIIIFFVEKNTFLQEPFSVGKRQPWAFSLPNFSNISQNQRLSIHPLSSRCARHHFRYKWFNVKQTRPDKVPIPRGCILFQFFRSGLHINNMLSADSWIWKLEN